MIPSRIVFGLSLLAAALPFSIWPVQETRIIGEASVVDGDTLEIAGVRVRLYGIDAPELAQSCTYPDGTTWSCGTAAMMKLAAIVKDQVVICRKQDTDFYGRTVAVCFAGEIDVGAAMVNAGLAIAYRQYSMRYVADEEAARLTGRGIWLGTFQVPEDWRRDQRR